MYFDWITWSIWLMGFIIMIVWILIPVKEFKKLVKKKRFDIQEEKNTDSHTRSKN